MAVHGQQPESLTKELTQNWITADPITHSRCCDPKTTPAPQMCTKFPREQTVQAWKQCSMGWRQKTKTGDMLKWFISTYFRSSYFISNEFKKYFECTEPYAMTWSWFYFKVMLIKHAVFKCHVFRLTNKYCTVWMYSEY